MVAAETGDLVAADFAGLGLTVAGVDPEVGVGAARCIPISV